MGSSIVPLATGAAVGMLAVSTVLYVGASARRLEAPQRAEVRVEDPAERSRARAERAAPPDTALPDAVRDALSRHADSLTLTRLFLGWAGEDIAAALDGLTLIEKPAVRRAVSLALLKVAGNDWNGIDQIAAALPAADRMNFIYDAIAQRALGEPAAAISLALGLSAPTLQNEALRRAARVLGRGDPHAALALATAITGYTLADSYRAAVLEEWANGDPEGFLDFVATADSTKIPAQTRIFTAVAATAPDRLLALVDSLPTAVQSAARRAALDSLVTTDPGGAWAYLSSMPHGSQRESLLRSTSRSFAQHDLDAAMAWVTSVQRPDPNAVTGVLQVLAETDHVRAVDVVIAQLEVSGTFIGEIGFPNIIASFVPGPREELGIVADRFSTATNPTIVTAYAEFLGHWAENDAQGVYDWLMLHPDRLTVSAALRVAPELTSRRPDFAKQAAEWIPEELRSNWIYSVARELGRTDLDGTLQWISRYQGEPVYEDAIRAAIEGLSLSSAHSVEDATAAARYLEQASPQIRANSLPMVANLWATHDPQAAAQWVERITVDDGAADRRNAALANVAMRWARHDTDAAEEWALALPNGESRDRALGALIQASAAFGHVDSRVIDAFSSDETRQNYLVSMMTTIGQSDPDLGRELIERYIDDPALRETAAQRLIEAPSSRFGTGVVIYN